MFDFLKRKKKDQRNEGIVLSPISVQECLEIRYEKRIFEIPLPVVLPYSCPECEITTTNLESIGHVVELGKHVSVLNLNCNNKHSFMMWSKSDFSEPIDSSELRQQRNDYKDMIDLIKGDEGDHRKQIWSLHEIINNGNKKIESLEAELLETKKELEDITFDVKNDTLPEIPHTPENIINDAEYKEKEESKKEELKEESKEEEYDEYDDEDEEDSIFSSKVFSDDIDYDQVDRESKGLRDHTPAELLTRKDTPEKKEDKTKPNNSPLVKLMLEKDAEKR